MNDVVTVIGSYAVGLTMRAPRIPVAGETLLADEFDQGPGGKGSNQAIQAARMGVPARLVAAVGRDGFGDAALALWASEGVDATLVRREADVATGAGFILLDAAGENRIMLYPGANALLDARRIGALADDIAGSAVVLAQLETAVAAAAAAMRAGRACGATTILNPAPAITLPDGLLADVDLLVPNETEARILLGLAPEAPADEAGLCAALLDRGAGAVVMTLGARGALMADAGGVTHVDAVAADVVDTTGAGDAFCGTLAAGLAQGRTREDAVRRAVCAGALACNRLGVVPSLPLIDRLERELSKAVAR
jgi:ribokinase